MQNPEADRPDRLQRNEPANDAEARDVLRRTSEERDAALAANRAKTEFLAVLSHEVRTPLNAILGYLDLLGSGVGGSLSEEHAAFVTRSRASAKHVLTLVEEILDLALIESGQLSLEQHVGHLGDAVEGAVALVAPQAGEGGVKLRAVGLEGGTGPIYRGHEGRVRQILVNLLANAVKFTGPGGTVTITADVVDEPVREATAPAGPAVFVRVEDTGTGIEPEELNVVFEPSIGGRSPTGPSREGRGRGLGLAISRRLARFMGGDITARSAPGEGSRFVLWLPVPAPGEVSAAEEAGADAASPAPPVDALRTVGEVILKELERIVRAFVGRLRMDPDIPTAHVQDEAVLENHIATFLADLAYGLVAMDRSSGLEGGEREEEAEIQRMLSRRHGEQRARLGWSEAELRREFAVLRDELEAAVERRTLHSRPTMSRAVDEALSRLLQQSEEGSIEALRRVHEEGAND